jgi:hypothetical protein
MFDVDDPSANPLIDPSSDLRNNYGFSPFADMGAPAGDDRGVMTGISSFDEGWKIAEAIDKGDWKEAVLAVAALDLDMAGAVLDPISYVASQLLAWELEHIQPARAALHSLSGDPGMVKGYANSWSKLADHMLKAGADLNAASQSGTTRWTGDAAEAYRRRAAEVANACRGIAGAATGMAKLTSGMAEVVGAVRGAVRDLLAAIVGSLVGWAIEIIGSFGLAEPLVEAQATRAIAKVVAKVAELVSRLETVVDAALMLLSALLNVLDGLYARLKALGTEN